MASKAFRLLLDKSIPEEPAWSARKGLGNPGSDPENGGFESPLGRAEAEKTGDAHRFSSDFRIDGVFGSIHPKSGERPRLLLVFRVKKLGVRRDVEDAAEVGRIVESAHVPFSACLRRRPCQPGTVPRLVSI
jgi:hypothetical protein